MIKVQSFFNIKNIITLLILLGLFALWTYKGIFETEIHVDLARDLNFLSDLWIHRIVWLGPMTSANFPASPIYYYLLYPGLILSGGNGLSVIFSQAFFALLALGTYSYLGIKKSFTATLLVILTIGLSGWWITASAHPWNGYMYVSFVLLALTSLWFKQPLFLSALLFGIAVAIDPVAILGIPVIFYEWWVNSKRIKRLLQMLAGLLLPWTPIIVYEIITKGFLTRHWLAYPSSAGISFSPQIINLSPLLAIINLTRIQAIIILLTSFWLGTARMRYWLIFTSLPLLLLVLVTPLRQYYLLGLVCALVFIISVILASKTLGKIILLILIMLSFQTINLPPPSFSNRSIPTLSNTVNTFIQKDHLDKSKKYALVSVRNQQNSTPQADDYRFFLRTKGFQALGIDQYPQADMLLLFIEVPNFNWPDFEDWHINRFGSRKFISKQNIGGIEIIKYGRP